MIPEIVARHAASGRERINVVCSDFFGLFLLDDIPWLAVGLTFTVVLCSLHGENPRVRHGGLNDSK